MNKIRDLKIFSRLLALLSAGVLSVTSLPAFAEGNVDDNTNDTPITTVEERGQFTTEEYITRVSADLPDMMKPKLKKSEYDIFGLLYTSDYYTNYKYFRDIRQDLIDYGFITENLKDMENIASSFPFILSEINGKILKKDADINKMIDFSELIIDPQNRELTHSALLNYVTTYEKGTLDCEEFQELLKQLEQLRKDCYFLGYLGTYNMLYDLYREVIVASYDPKEVKEYYTIKGKEITGVNKKKYKNEADLFSKLLEKEERTELEELILLTYKDYRGNMSFTDVDSAIEQIEKDYKTSEKK